MPQTYELTEAETAFIVKKRSRILQVKQMFDSEKERLNGAIEVMLNSRGLEGGSWNVGEDAKTITGEPDPGPIPIS